MVFEVAAWLDILSPRLALRDRADDTIKFERVLAMARVMLSVSSLVALYLDSADAFAAPDLLSGLLLLYSAHAVGLLVLLWRWSEPPAGFVWTVQATDILWPCVISVFTNGPGTTFFLFFIFALLAAAFRWGMREALLTMVVAITTLSAKAYALNHAWIAVPDAIGLDIAFMLRIVYLVIFALLIGYLAESEKRRRDQALGIS